MPAHADKNPREYALRSQTDVTSNPELGFKYAETAYKMGLENEVTATDPTLAGEAAAKAGFRMAQLPDPVKAEVAAWFERSYKALSDENPRSQREQIATGLLEGRAFALLALRTSIPEEKHQRSIKASDAFAKAHGLAAVLRTGLLRDPYETMLNRHRATHEAVQPDGSTLEASKIALGGIALALLSRPERVNSSVSGLPSAGSRHAKFVSKQIAMNCLAFVLAATRPLSGISAIDGVRRKFALHLLG